jgi:hypothetical protein
LARDVVEQRMSYQWLVPLSPCSSFSLGNNPYSPWSFNGNPICVRGLAREKLVYPQGCRLSQDDSSLSFTMLLRLFPLSHSPPLARGNIAMLGDILLDSDSYIMSVFQTLGILDS